MGWKLLGAMNALFALVGILGPGSGFGGLRLIVVAMTLVGTVGVFLHAYGASVQARFWRIFSWLFAANGVGVVTFFIVRSLEVGSRHSPAAVALVLAFVIGCQFFTWLALYRLSGRTQQPPSAEAWRAESIPSVRRPPETISSPVRSMAANRVRAVSLELRYKPSSLVGLSFALIAIGLVTLLLAQAPLEGRRGIVRLMVSILGPHGMQVLLAAISLLLTVGGLRFFWLALDRLAAGISARGIFVRSAYYTGLLPWTAVRGVDLRRLPGWGNASSIVIEREDRAGFLLRLVGLGNKVVISPKLLDADDDAIEAWIEMARNRGRPPCTDVGTPDLATGRPAFGRRRSLHVGP